MDPGFCLPFDSLHFMCWELDSTLARHSLALLDLPGPYQGFGWVVESWILFCCVSAPDFLAGLGMYHGEWLVVAVLTNHLILFRMSASLDSWILIESTVLFKSAGAPWPLYGSIFSSHACGS